MRQPYGNARVLEMQLFCACAQITDTLFLRLFAGWPLTFVSTRKGVTEMIDFDLDWKRYHDALAVANRRTKEQSLTLFGRRNFTRER